MEATTFRSTTNTSTTDAWRNGSVSPGGAGVCATCSSVTLVGTMVFHGRSPASTWAR